MSDKKKAYLIMQVSSKEFIVSPETASKSLRFSDYVNDRHWSKTNNFIQVLDDSAIGHLYIYAKCKNGENQFIIIVSTSEIPDDSEYTYFLLYEGERTDVNRSFIPRKNHTDFIVSIVNIDELETNKADKVNGAVAGNFASLTDSGNLADSGLKPTDFVKKNEIGGGNTGLESQIEELKGQIEEMKVRLNAKASRSELNKIILRIKSFSVRFNSNVRKLNKYFDSQHVYSGFHSSTWNY